MLNQNQFRSIPLWATPLMFCCGQKLY